MNDPETLPTDEQLAALLAAADKDAPPPDPAFLAGLREKSLAAFETATSSTPRKRTVLPISFRWLAASAAALALVGIGVAYWIGAGKVPTPVPPAEEKFIAEGSLTDDGRIGKVTDAQGVVAVKPVMHGRWSPVQPRLVLKPGDWLRTDARGANAVAFRLVKSATVIVGPHSTVELIKSDEVRLVEGELEVTTGGESIELQGPNQETVTITGKQHYRVEKEKLVRVEKEPLWLEGFKGTTANESLGSLVAMVDGRDVPLTVGYHHVTADIRDQIARTTIEESFVNTTPDVLEGVFYFPLPQDASISGFGMWIGDEYVEADVVEKQRAREIYETILRERRDPGLLEWTGGNIFKARIYPIPGRAEKRIRITYTQVLPLQGNRYRYSYGLQSELLKQHPLRDLKIDLKVNSAVPLKSVTSPTHAARVAKTDHSGHVEFTAQEHKPTRDFETVIEIDGSRPDVVVVPHRRGDNCYFMVQLTPPGPAGDLDRPILPDGEPLSLLLLADTSASMDKGQRSAQTAVISSLLGALTAKDTINVAACDVNCDWVFEKPVPATPANVAAVTEFLDRRTSLGWTDLDKAFGSALGMSAAGTHVVYLGDATPTTGNADPVAFAKRLQRLYEGKAGTFHAVAVGSSYEPGALKAIASLGGGSARRVTADRGPQATALDLLTEIATPGLRDLKVEFVGLRTARVYPEMLPNVPTGTQQILLGRYLPEGKDQSGEIVVTGTLGGKPVRFTSKISLKDAEAGNSFVPRLWARMHLDKLLEQGRSEAVKQDVIALSEEFHIITPYTSLLVLESDADRERFAVKRRFQMRDGERFFADGRDNASFELKQKQMALAGDYRTALRRGVLAQLDTLGRDTRLFRGAARPKSYADRKFKAEQDEKTYFIDTFSRSEAGFDTWGGLPDNNEFSGLRDSLVRRSEAVQEDSEATLGREWRRSEWDLDKAIKAREGREHLGQGDFDGDELDFRGFAADAMKDGFASEEAGRPLRLRGTAANPYYYRARPRSQLEWLGSLFPTIAAPTHEPEEPKTTWPARAVALSRSLLRTEKLAQVKGGIVVTRQTDRFDGDRGELSWRGKRLELVSPAAWLGRSAPDGGQVIVNWCDVKEYGVYSTAFQLGRVRASNAHDLRQLPLELTDDSLTPLHVSCGAMLPTIDSVAKDREMLTLKYATSSDYEMRVLIDTTRHVVLGVEHRQKGKPTSVTKFDDFVEVAGTWWARRVETFDDKERRISLTTQTVAELPADEFARRMTQELTGQSKALFLRHPLPTVGDAKKAVAAGKATLDDRAVLTLYFGATQQWARALEHLQECEKLADGKTGMRWLRDSFLLAGRRHDELRKRVLDEATALAAATDADARANDYYLAEYITNYPGQVLQTNESMGLSDTLQKVYERQSPHLEAAKKWRSSRVSLLENAGQHDKSLRLAKELAGDYPRDSRLQYDYAQWLARDGDFPAAYAWLDRVLGPDSKWNASEEEQLRLQYARLLQQQGRHRELADHLAAWVKRNPESSEAYARYLSALVWTNQAERAESLAGQWLRESLIEDELPAPVAARFSAARDFALGQGHNLHASRIDERWHAPLAAAVLYFARSDAHVDRAGSILQHGRFTNTDAGRAVRKTLAETLLKEIDTLPTTRLDHFVSWVLSDSDPDRADWNKIAAGLRKRWDAEKKPDIKYWLGITLHRVLSSNSPEEVLPFLRMQFETAPEAYRGGYAEELFDALLGQSWSPEIEDEAFALLDQLADPDSESGLFTRVAALHRLTDRMIEARFEARMKSVESPEKLTRAELQKKQAAARKLAREGFSDRLRKEAPRHAKPFGAWLVAERVWIDVRLERDLKPAAEDCWAFLTTEPVKARPEDDGPGVGARLDDALRGRFLTTLQNLAARKGADPALVEKLLKYVDRQLKDHPEEPRWRGEKYRLLIALDRVKDLEAELTRWVSGPDADNRWRLALGYLLAEQGKVPEAIRQFEALEADDELGPGAYRGLAEWYLVENRRAQSEKARTAAFNTADEYQLSRQINVYLQPWERTTGHPPSQLDPEVLATFKALFEKSANPQSYLGHLQHFYQASRDFRLLSMLPDGVVGHTAAKVYPFLQGMQSVLNEVRDEATADELVKRVAAIRPTAKTPVDQRALDLLELMVERRAAEVQNQAGPHADKALAALVRSFKHEWSPGEPRLAADFLAALGSVPQAAIAKEQLRQMEVLHRGTAAGSPDRLHVAQRYAETLNAHTRRAEATDLLEAALKEFEEANNGVLPATANNALSLLISLTESTTHYERGEKFLLAQLKHPVHAEQRDRLAQRLNELYHRALEYKGEVSLGSGAALYKALEKKLLADLNGAGQNHRSRLLEQLSRVYRTAHSLKLAGVEGDVKAFAFEALPPILKEQVGNYESAVNNFADAVSQVLGPRDAIAFLLDRIDDAPDWLRYNNQDAWNQHAYRLGGWRTAVKDLGDLEPRLMKFVLDELRRDLRSRESRHRGVYDRRHGHYWTEKEADFAKVAEEVLAERKASSASVEYIAEYLFAGLAREKRAIEVLLAAHEQKILAESGRAKLIDYLHSTQRYAESIALLVPLIEKHPENLNYRTRLMFAYYRTGKRGEHLALLEQTDAFFHEKDRWNETVLATLAASCLDTDLYAQSVAYYEELIPRYQRDNPRRGGSDGTLSNYYTSAALAYSGLGKTKQAVDMASAAVVSWGPNLEQRKDTLEKLVRVLEGARDLDAYVAELDKEKLHSAIVRKAIGRAYIRKNEHAKAVPQLQLASELQPDDAEIYTALLACHDKLGDKEAAVRELFRAVELSRRDAKLFEQLGQRFADLKRPVEAERAYTSIVEMLPNESEGHALLAEVREKQNRWPEAIAHWARVAEIRALEPTGLVKLAAAQIASKDWDSATKTVRKLRSQTWPPRFTDVEKQTRELEKKLEERPKP